MVTSSDLQHTRLKGEKQFQGFCLKLIRRYWKDDYAQLHGRRGQRQQGVDITGRDNRNGFKHAGLQCKGAETNDPRQITESELVDEVEKAKGYTPKLDIFIVAYAGDRDAELQKKAVALDNENEKAGLFKVVLWSWDEIVERALDFPDVAEELLVQNKVPTVAALDPKRPKGNNAAALEAAAKSFIAVYQSALPPDTDQPSKGHLIAEAKIDVLRDQILAGNGSTVVEPLREFIRSLAEDANPHVRFRAHANLGAALIQQGQLESAVVAFDEAAAAEPGTAASHAYKARAALFREKADLARAEAEEALKLDPAQKLASMCLIETIPAKVPSTEVEQRLLTITGEADIAAALSRRYSDENAHDDALRVARQITPPGWQRDTVIAQAILHRFENNLEASVGAPLSDTETDLIEEARDLLEKAWERVKKRGDRKNWVHVGANLCFAYRLTGEEKKGDVVALEAHDIAPDSLPIIECAVLAYVHRRDLGKAKSLAEKMAESGGSEEAVFAGNIFASATSWDEAYKWANKALNESGDDILRARAAELLIVSIQRKTTADQALKEAGDLRARFAPSVTFESRVAEIARILGNEKAIAEARKRLAGFDADKLNAIERLALADAFADDGNWVRSAELLEGLHTLERPSEILKRRLFALHRADLRAQARDLYNSLREGALNSKEIRRLGAAIFERSGMLPKASEELMAAVELDPSDLRSRLDWARLCIRNDDERRLSRWAKGASIDVDGEAEELLELAQILDRYGRRKDALRLGYRTVLKHWGTSERLHMMYMSLFLLHPKVDPFLELKQVAEDTVVFLESGHGDKARYRIEADAEPASDLLSPNHPFAQQLLGSKVGDTITQSQGIGQPTTWRVVEIKHKYTDLFHRVLGSHETTFPGSHALGRFHIDTKSSNAFEPIFEQVRERAKVVNDVAKLYEQSIVPIDVVGKMLGIDSIEASRGLRFRSNIRLDTCIGTDDERQPVMDRLSTVTKIMVDPVTLSLWQEIELLPVLEKVEDLKIEVVQAAIDTLTARAEEARNAIQQKGGTLEVRGEKFALFEPTKTERKVYSESCYELLTWCRNNTTVVPTESRKGLEGRKVEQFLSEVSIDTLGTAVEAKAAVILEDRRLRGLGVSLGLETASWTQPLLMVLRSEGKLSQQEYTTLIAKLERHRIGFVSVGSDELSFAAKRGATSDEFSALADSVARANVDARSLIPVVVQFVTGLWADPDPKWVRDRLASELLERLLRRPDGCRLFRIIVKGVYENISEFRFPMNLMARWWSEYVDRFVDGHFIRESVLKKEK